MTVMLRAGGAILLGLMLPAPLSAQTSLPQDLAQEASSLDGFGSSDPTYAMVHGLAMVVDLPTFIENQSRPLLEATRMKLIAANRGQENEAEQFMKSQRPVFRSAILRLSVRAVSSALPQDVDAFTLYDYAKTDDGKQVAALLHDADALCFQLPQSNKVQSCASARARKSALALDANKDRRALFDVVNNMQRSALAFIQMTTQTREGMAILDTEAVDKAFLKMPLP